MGGTKYIGIKAKVNFWSYFWAIGSVVALFSGTIIAGQRLRDRLVR